MREWAAQACDVYTQWCNGEVYGYQVVVYRARHSHDGHLYDDLDDYRFDTALWDDSCWGFYGEAYFEGELKAVLENARTFCREEESR
jgi:hypothetical protein